MHESPLNGYYETMNFSTHFSPFSLCHIFIVCSSPQHEKHILTNVCMHTNYSRQKNQHSNYGDTFSNRIWCVYECVWLKRCCAIFHSLVAGCLVDISKWALLSKCHITQLFYGFATLSSKYLRKFVATPHTVARYTKYKVARASDKLISKKYHTIYGTLKTPVNLFAS